MKKSILIICLTVCSSVVFAHPVSNAIAQKVAKHFMMEKMNTKNLSLHLNATYGSTQQPALYVFDVNNRAGFVIVSADDVIIPILAYSIHYAFSKNSGALSPEVNYWIKGYTDQIESVIKNKIKPGKEIAQKWASLLNGALDGNTAGRGTSVSPLLTTRWDQLPLYNKYCPGNAPTGCVATAMAQIMKYWGNPLKGTGSNSYNSSTLGGTLSADFGNTTYNWSNMPDAINNNSSISSINDIATLMFQCGVAVNMDYNINGSGAQVISPYPGYPSAENALITYFGYSSLTHGEIRANYDDETWIALLKKEIDNNRPILYAGFGQEGGHAFDFDGYDNDNKFHINWGWSGYGNGYYTVDHLEPTFNGTGGGVGNFNTNQQALIGIESGKLKLQIDGPYNVSAPTIFFNTPYSISAQIKNAGNLNFNGGHIIIIAIDTAQPSNQITLTTQKVHITAEADYTFKFSTEGLTKLPPATYRLIYKYENPGSTAQITIQDGTAVNGSQFLTITYPKGISETSKSNKIVYFPNPANNDIHIFWNNGGESMKSIRMLNAQGAEVYRWENRTSNNLKIPLSQYANGLYFLIFDTNNGLISKKINIQK